MTRYRTSGADVDAWQLSINHAWPWWLAEALLQSRVESANPRISAGLAGMMIKNPDGAATARPGDWIVHVEGELTVVPAEIFERTHHQIHEAAE